MVGAVESDVAIVGGGPAGLMASDVLVRGGVRVTIYDQMPAVGRKFLLAGRGGLNLTHSEPLDQFLRRYGSAETRIRSAIEASSPDDLRAFSAELGVALAASLAAPPCRDGRDVQAAASLARLG